MKNNAPVAEMRPLETETCRLDEFIALWDGDNKPDSQNDALKVWE